MTDSPTEAAVMLALRAVAPATASLRHVVLRVWVACDAAGGLEGAPSETAILHTLRELAGEGRVCGATGGRWRWVR